ncbi:TPA: hypothetical protein RQK05_000894 [Vibrio vulnificus]|nr:hypothetical protein [Vibrio vulnificus]HDY7746308.1 hypothetical protein [Vibrio vulnificus]HDY7755903.1 hypothetical protein [Vibrio vulnificus]HDY7760320.1 hypothetical protein [Vibrio vulnificus]HDY7769443.1 hypothetical protein [Vibrio vulnificus]
MDNQPVYSPWRKYISEPDIITFYAGDECPIVLEKALALEIIDDTTFDYLCEYLDEDERAACIAFNSGGEFLPQMSNDWGCIELPSNIGGEVLHAGTGGKPAADFYVNSWRIPFANESVRVEASMTAAFSADECSGGPLSLKIWGDEASKIDNLEPVCVRYKQQVKQQIKEYIQFANEQEEDMKKQESKGKAALKSVRKTSLGVNGSKFNSQAALARAAARRAYRAEMAAQ